MPGWKQLPAAPRVGKAFPYLYSMYECHCLPCATVTGVPAGEAGAEAEDNMRVLAEMGVRTALQEFACGAGEFGLPG